MRGTNAFVAASPEVTEGEPYEFGCADETELHLRDIRNSIVDHARGAGLEAFFAFGGIITVVGFTDAAVVDAVRVQPRLKLRVDSHPSLTDPVTVLVARADTRWVLAGSLADTSVARWAVGERALKLAGDGPDRGEVVAVVNGIVRLSSSGTEVDASAANYTLAANSRFVRQHLGGDTLRRLQVASGSLASSGRRNRYAVKDRFKVLTGLLDALGWDFDLSGQRLFIEPAWTEIRVQDAPDAA